MKVDGQRLSGSNFTKSADPTIITLSATYLQTLTNGNHTLTIVWSDGSAEASFGIKGTATSSSSGTTASSGSSSSKSSNSSGTTSSASDKTTTSDTQQTKETGTTDMPIVNKSKSSSKDAASTTKTTGNSNKGTNGSSKIIGEGSSSRSSLLNRYAALISLVVVAGCGIGAGTVAIIRRMNRRRDEEDMY